MIPPFFNAAADAAFDVVSAVMGTPAIWMSAAGDVPGRVLFNEPSQGRFPAADAASLGDVDFEPDRPSAEYRAGTTWDGLRAAANKAGSREKVKLGDRTFIVTRVRSINDGRDFIANLDELK